MKINYNLILNNTLLGKMMFDYISENIKNAINKMKLRDTEVALRLNNYFRKNELCEIKEGKLHAIEISAVKIGALQKGGAKHIFLHELFGLAGKLGCFGYGFVNETIRNLGSFEIKLLFFKNGLEYNEHILELEKGGRIGIFPSFPSYPYRPIADFNEQSILFHDTSKIEKQRIEALINKNIAVNNQRLENLKPNTNNKIQANSTEYYTIDLFVKFLFSPLEVPLTIEQKIKSLERMIDVFKNNTSNHCFFYTSTDFYQRQYASMEILKLNNLVYLNLPIRSAILVIRNDKFYNKLNRFFSTIKKQTCFRTTRNNEEAVELLEAGLKHLKKSKNPFCTFNDFVTFRDQLRSSNLQELLKLAFPRLF